MALKQLWAEEDDHNYWESLAVEREPGEEVFQ
jgi:hypothetical protein